MARLDSIIYLFCAARKDVIPEAVCGGRPKCSKCPILKLCARQFIAKFEDNNFSKFAIKHKSAKSRRNSRKNIQSEEYNMPDEKFTDSAIENKEKADKLFSKIQDERVLIFLNTLMNSLNKKAKRVYAVTHEFKYVLPQGRHCSLFIRPASYKIDLYFENFTPADIQRKNSSKKLPLIVKENTSNPMDQFRSVIEVNGEWLQTYSDKSNDLIQFIIKLVDNLESYNV